MELNFFSPDVIADPFPYYRQMISAGPMVRNDTLGSWMVVGHAEVTRVLKDYGHFSSSAMAGVGRVGMAMANSSMSAADPPDHSRLRGVVQRAFTPRAVAELEQGMERFVQEALEPLRAGETLDAINSVSSPLSIGVMSDLLGVSRQDRQAFKDWSDDLLAGNSPFSPPDKGEAAEKATECLKDYFREQVADRRNRGTDGDLVGRLVAANEDDTLNDDELIASCVLLLFAGHETTAKLIGNSLLCLALNPDERRRLVGDPGLMNTAVEELTRLNGPPQMHLRVTTGPVELGGQELPGGEMLFLMLACANRDPTVFPDPERLDLGRADNPHVGFSHGPHFCLGASLARLETRVALRNVLAVAPDYALADPAAPPEWSDSFFLRGLLALEIVAGQ